ncbi:hypothetical protein Pmani_002538 [Petrolisthes manimaculis]|uniref:Tc1-like transposase DDE domain-containing protein n=1 Tax=Petrolisthes manimaculis TaxID=1843537 RepID=A0AAE1PPW9_9EUCA|nr:hypothetical protein Pmani_036942 [Petrolisthes manimaculis]KAK4312008.1 hypothetical protein Pmani_016524 [Petrolisthes manimaculis]KAK4326987.1 hypothetical protein Pmani_002538 [Petrolisthes manimaculis]
MVGTTTNIGERARIIALREEGVQINEIAARVGHHRATVLRILAASRCIGNNQIPLPKPRLGKKKKTPERTDTLIKRCVIKNPFITSVEIKKEYPELLRNVSERTIRDRLHRDLKLRAHRAARKPYLTKSMKNGIFLHDGAPPHKCKNVNQWLRENNIPEIEWPGNSPDLNPIENVWSLMKNELKGKDTSTVIHLKETVLQLWRGIDSSYFEKIASSMPRRIQAVINAHGDNTKY